MKTTVTASQPSRWRAGQQFGPQPVEIEISTATDAVAMQAILADPVLQVADRDAVAAHVEQLLAEPAEPAKPAKGKAKAD
jgi:hypothetical protein